MEQEEIKALLERFFNGETSEEEEAMVREYLSDPDTSQIFASEKEYLSLISQAVPEPSDEFNKSLEAVTLTERKNFRSGYLLRYGLSAAAAVALLIGSYLIFDYERPREWADTYNDPELAMAEVKSILTTVSGNMKAGTEPLGSMRRLSVAPAAIKELGRINGTVGNNLDGLRYLNNMEKTPKTTGNDNK